MKGKGMSLDMVLGVPSGLCAGPGTWTQDYITGIHRHLVITVSFVQGQNTLCLLSDAIWCLGHGVQRQAGGMD